MNNQELALSEKLEGNKFYSNQDFHRAILHYNKAIEYYDDPVFRSNRSACFFELGDYKLSSEDTAIILKPVIELKKVEVFLSVLSTFDKKVLVRHLKSLYFLNQKHEFEELFHFLPVDAPEFAEISKLNENFNQNQNIEKVNRITLPLCLGSQGEFQFYGIGLGERMTNALDIELNYETDLNGKFAPAALNRPPEFLKYDVMKEKQVRFLFGGCGDAKKGFRTLVGLWEQIKDKKENLPQVQMYFNDLLDLSIARLVLMLVLLKRLSKYTLDDVVNQHEEAIRISTTVFTFFTCYNLQPYMHQRLSVIIQVLKKASESEKNWLENPETSWIKVEPKDLIQLNTVFSHWLSKKCQEETDWKIVSAKWKKTAAGIDSAPTFSAEYDDNLKKMQQQEAERELKNIESDAYVDSFKHRFPPHLRDATVEQRRAFMRAGIKRISKEDPRKSIRTSQLGKRHPNIEHEYNIWQAEGIILWGDATPENYNSFDWKFNPTFYEPNKKEKFSTNIMPYDYLHRYEKDEVDEDIRMGLATTYLVFSRQFCRIANALGGCLEKNILTISLDIGDILSFGRTLQNKGFRNTFDKILTSNVPDYAGLLSTFVHLNPLLKPFNSENIPHLETNTLDNPVAYDNFSHHLYSRTGFKSYQQLSQILGIHFGAGHVWSTVLWQPIENIQKIQKNELIEYLYSLYLSLCEPAERNEDEMLVEQSPSTMMLFFYVVERIVALGYPKHWLSFVLDSILENNVLTYASFPPSAPASPNIKYGSEKKRIDVSGHILQTKICAYSAYQEGLLNFPISADLERVKHMRSTLVVKNIVAAFESTPQFDNLPMHMLSQATAPKESSACKFAAVIFYDCKDPKYVRMSAAIIFGKEAFNKTKELHPAHVLSCIGFNSDYQLDIYLPDSVIKPNNYIAVIDMFSYKILTELVEVTQFKEVLEQ